MKCEHVPDVDDVPCHAQSVCTVAVPEPGKYVLYAVCHEHWRHYMNMRNGRPVRRDGTVGHPWYIDMTQPKEVTNENP